MRMVKFHQEITLSSSDGEFASEIAWSQLEIKTDPACSSVHEKQSLSFIKCVKTVKTVRGHCHGHGCILFKLLKIPSFRII